jgi:pimeloyl-ACP methyl ester carboxylesterase
VTECLYVREVDPAYSAQYPGVSAYADGGNAFADYDPATRGKALRNEIRKIANSGRVTRPLISVHGTLDALIPIKSHGRAYRDLIEQNGFGANYRLYEVQNGNHLEAFKASLPSLELIQPHAHRAFELLEAWVEAGDEPPPTQCVARNGTIGADPAAPAQCPSLLVE